jgi:hypothetical protein
MDTAVGFKRQGPKTPAVNAGIDASAALVTLVGLSGGLLGQGAYLGRLPWRVGLLVAAATTLAFAVGPGRVAALRSTPVLAAGLLGGWAVVDGALHASVLAGVRQALLLAGFAAVLLTCRRLSSSGREVVLTGLLGAGVLLAAAGWLGVVWHYQPWGLVAQGLWRASSPITYPNATAAVLVPLALIAVARLTQRRRSVPLGLAVTGLLAGAGATGSRAGLLALAVGLLVLAALLGPPMVARSARAPAVGAAIALAGMLPSVPAASAPQPALAGLALLLGLILGIALPRMTWPATVATAAGVAVLGTLAMAGLGSASALSMAARAISEQRATLASPDRADAVRAALRLVAASPAIGSGPGQARLEWTETGGAPRAIRYAHNEYLQIAVELGLVGTALLAVLFLAVIRLLWNARGSRPPTPLWAGVVAGLTALAMHGALDFLWHLPAIPLTAAALLGVATPTRPHTGSPPIPTPFEKESS